MLSARYHNELNLTHLKCDFHLNHSVGYTLLLPHFVDTETEIHKVL